MQSPPGSPGAGPHTRTETRRDGRSGGLPPDNDIGENAVQTSSKPTTPCTGLSLLGAPPPPALRRSLLSAAAPA